MAEGKYVAYYRISTGKQEASGLGIKAQKQAVREYLGSNGWELIGEWKETESGKRADRPELEKALRQAKREMATLVIAKIDRLSRNVGFISRLMESGIEFVAVDNPHANKLTVQILAVMAEFERDQISVCLMIMAGGSRIWCVEKVSRTAP